MKIKCESQFLNQNTSVNQKSISKSDTGNSFSRQTTQICDKNGNNLLMIAPTVIGVINRSANSSFQTSGLSYNTSSSFGDWIRAGNKSGNYQKLPKISQNTSSQLLHSTITIPAKSENNSLNPLKKRLKIEGEADEEQILPLDSRLNNLSGVRLVNSQDSPSTQLNIVTSSIRKRVKISFVKETLSDATNISSDKS